MGFAINPKNLTNKETAKFVVILKKEINKKSGLKVAASSCYDVWVETFDRCCASGMSINNAAAVATGAYEVCNAMAVLSGN